MLLLWKSGNTITDYEWLEIFRTNIEEKMNEQEYRLFIDYVVGELQPGEFAVRANFNQRMKAYLKYKKIDL